MNSGMKQPSNSTDFHLVLIHGWGMNQGIWTHFATVLSSALSIKVSCLDLPGFGTQYDQIPHPYNIENMANAINEQLPESCILVGWSLGGLVAQKIVSSPQSKVVAHIQLCSTPRFAELIGWPGIKNTILHMFAQQLSSDHASILKRFLAIQCMGLDSPNQTVKKMLAMLQDYPLSSNEALSASLQVLTDTDLRDTLANSSKVPCMRIFGRLDSLVPAKAIPLIAELSPHSIIHTLPKASHAPFISHEAETLELIKDFVGQLRMQISK